MHCVLQIMSNKTASQLLLLYNLEAEWGKLVAITMVELVLELDPVQAQGMQEC